MERVYKLKKQSLWRTILKERHFLIMLLPGMLYLLVNNYLPMFGTMIAFKSMDYAKGIWRSPWVGFQNFKYLFKTSDAWVITRNTILYNLLFIVLITFFSIVFAIMLNELRNRWGAKLYQSVMFLPYFLSMVVVAYLGFSMLSEEYGFINKAILEPLGFNGIAWYGEPKYWPFILPLVHVWKNVGYSSVLYLAAIIGIDNEYYEAALIDGANKWQRITRITIPMIKPVIVIMTLLAVGRILNADFGLFYQVPLDAGALYPTTNVIDTYVYRALLTFSDIGMSSAAGLYQSVVGLFVVLGANALVNRYSKDDALF